MPLRLEGMKRGGGLKPLVFVCFARKNEKMKGGRDENFVGMGDRGEGGGGEDFEGD